MREPRNGGTFANLVVTRAGAVATMAGHSARPKIGPALADPGLLRDCYIAARGGLIAAVGPMTGLDAADVIGPETEVVDAGGRLVTPGLVDPHTHLVFAGSREHEFVRRLGGARYLEILAEGGGILSTVRATRAAGADELLESTLGRLDRMLVHGTTTAEAKSGYGLDLAGELKQLRVVREAGRRHPVDVVPTFLGAHAVPPEYTGRPGEFVAFLAAEVLPAVAGEGLARFCDVFCEPEVFDREAARRMLEAGAARGLGAKLHADEIAPSGGAELAAELGAVSADHLVGASDQGIAALAAAGVVAVLLPGTVFNLMTGRYPRARAMVEAGVAVALATDFNPGTCPTESMPIIMALACRELRLHPAEALAAATINAAHAIGLGAEVGSIEPGKRANLVIWEAPGVEYLPYHFGVNLVHTVVKDGRVVARQGRPTWRGEAA